MLLLLFNRGGAPLSQITLSGTVYLQDGITPAGSGISVAATVNGGAIAGTGVTNSFSAYSITNVPTSAGDTIAVYLQNSPPEGGTVTISTGNNLSGVDIYEHTLIIRSDGGVMSNALLAQANNGDPDLQNVYVVIGGTLIAGTGGNTILVPAGSSFTPGGNIVSQGDLTLLGTFTAGTFQVKMQGSDTLSTAGNPLYDLWVFSGTTTLGNDLVVAHDVLVNGTLDVSANNYSISVAHNWQVAAILSPGSFVARQGTVTLNGSGQKISGQTTFWNLVKTVSSADSLTFQNGNLQVISNALTLLGASGQLLNIVSDSPGSQWDITVPATQNFGFLFVQDSNNATGVLAIAGPTSVNGGNNINWQFIVTPPGSGISFKRGNYLIWKGSDPGAIFRPAVNLFVQNAIPLQLTKSASDVRGYLFDFSDFAPFQGGQSIALASVSSTPSSPGALTLGRPQIIGASGVRVRISGGSPGMLYSVSVQVSASGGSVLTLTGNMLITP